MWVLEIIISLKLSKYDFFRFIYGQWGYVVLDYNKYIVFVEYHFDPNNFDSLIIHKLLVQNKLN